VLAAYPAFAILVAAAWDDIMRGWGRWCAFLLVALLGIGGAAVLAAPFVMDIPIAAGALIVSGGVLVSGALWLAWSYRRYGGGAAWMYRLSAVLIAMQLTVAGFVYPVLNSRKSPQFLGDVAKSLIAEDGRILLYKMHGEIQALYARRRGWRLNSPQELAAAMRKEGRGIVITDRSWWDELHGVFGSRLQPHPYEMGHKKLLWCSFGEDSENVDNQ
jgi:hypothetical protein